MFSWYFDNKRDVGETCELPLTSLCWKSQGIYIEINYMTLYISIVCSVVFFLLITIFMYLICCRETQILKVVHSTYATTYEYSQLNDTSSEYTISKLTNLNYKAFYKLRYFI